MPPRIILALFAVSILAVGGILLFRPSAPAPAASDAPSSILSPTAAVPDAPPPSPASETPANAPTPPPRPDSAAPLAPPASSDADLTRIESAVVSGEATSLSTLAPYLTHADPALREAAREGMLQMGLAEAAPLLREAAGKLKDPREAILLLDAADFLALPTLPIASGEHRRTPAPPPPQRENRPKNPSKSPLRP
jgi:hypothetical protein